MHIIKWKNAIPLIFIVNKDLFKQGD